MLGKYKESIKKILFTLMVLVFYRIAMLITLPGVNFRIISDSVKMSSFFKTIDFFLGGAIERCSILSLGIMPYLSASILVQFLSSDSGLHYFQEIKRDKEMGMVQLNSWTKYITILLAGINGMMLASNIFNSYSDGAPLVYISKFQFYSLSILLLMTGTFLSIWLSNQISKRGIGNGVSVIIFFNVLCQTGSSIKKLFHMINNGQINTLHLVYIILFLAGITLFTVFMESSYKYIDVYFPGMEGDTSMSQRLPIKINNSGVMPSVLTSSFVQFPHLLFSFLKRVFFVDSFEKIINYTAKGGPFYYLTFMILIFAMNILHSNISFDTRDVASKLEEYNIFVKNVPQGNKTKAYLDSVINKMNILSGVYLILLCGVSEIICDKINLLIGVDILTFTGTTVLIIVQISQLILKGVEDFNYNNIFDRIC